MKMNLPFSIEEFLNVFRNYNNAIFPSQIVGYLLGILLLFILLKKNKFTAKFVVLILAVYWIWNGTFYHICFFSEINPIAIVFGIIFIIQGIIFIIHLITNQNNGFSFSKHPKSIIGTFLILYAMVIYPTLGYLFGHIYPESPVFGVAPCPTTIFTFGILLQSIKKLPFSILIIPLLWSIIGFMAAIQLGITEDFGLLIAGIITLLLTITNKKAAK